ncbi:hypothetical protein G9C98_006590 [Cotesia typhae]|uniref:Uncharacterized protein n=1 Tax=Cotesia typhae TaxID=2053667 RepID=A0A8J5QQC7_9HYME|nr:hypothetical protein G9C98_006590 [Cotesia typhae]
MKQKFRECRSQTGDQLTVPRIHQCDHLKSQFPRTVTGAHLNMCAVQNGKSFFWLLVGSYFPSLVVESEDYSKVYPLTEKWSRIIEESGYFHLQATKPDTIAKPSRRTVGVKSKQNVITENCAGTFQVPVLRLSAYPIQITENLLAFVVRHGCTQYYTRSYAVIPCIDAGDVDAML